MKVSTKALSWAAPLLVLGGVGVGMLVISNITGLHLSVAKNKISAARLDGTYELYSTVEHVELPHGAKGLDAGAVRRFFQVGQQLSCRCVFRFQPACEAGPCGGDLSVWRGGRWSPKVPYTYLGDGHYTWTAPPDRCGCYGGHGIRATIHSRAQMKVAATNQVAGRSEVFELLGRQRSEWHLGGRVKGFPSQWKVIAAVDAAQTNF